MKKPCRMRSRHAGTIAGAVATLFATAYGPPSLANPTGAQVVSGSVNVKSPSAGQMNITQGTSSAIVNWNSFSIGANEAVRIAQPSATSTLLNRVMGNDPSVIAGRLQANGKVFLVNPAGVIFAQGSSVNVGSMIASTLNISDADFLAGRFHFVGTSAAPVSNAGSITASQGGTVAMLGGAVSNSGTVVARLGTVALGAGQDITVDFAGDGLTTLKINQGAANALIGNTGTLAADGGTVVMSAQTADALASTVINQQGIVRAQSLIEHNGHIILDGGTAGVTQAGGTLDATGGTGTSGGQIDVTGYDVALLANARVDASGAAGGGTVRFGGGAAGADPTIRNANATWMAPSASIHADALVNGNGGNIAAFSEGASRIHGTLSAKGGAQGGNGGLIETSGHYLDTTGAVIDASAPHGTGGTWKLDPFEVDIVDEATEEVGGSVMFGPFGTDSIVFVGDINTALNQGTSVTVSTTTGPGLSGNIVLESNISKTSGSNATLTFSAGGSISLFGNIIAGPTPAAGKLGVILAANQDGAAPGTAAITLATEGVVTIRTNGGNVSMGAGRTGTAGFDGSRVSVQDSLIDTTGIAPDAFGNGSVTIHGLAGPGISAVALGYLATINTSTGAIDIQGGLGATQSGNAFSGVQLSGASVTSVSGPIRVYGAGNGPRGFCDTFSSAGVQIISGSVIGTTSGSIDIRGSYTGAAATNANGAGVDFENSIIRANGTQATSVSIAGSTNGPLPGVQIISTIGGDTITAGPGGGVAIRAMNDNSTKSLAISGTTAAIVSSNNGQMAILPGGVDPATFAFTSGDALPIGLFATVAGMTVDQATYGKLGLFNTLVLGSTTQTGKITVGGPTCEGTCIFPNFNLTLANPGAGSAGIALQSGVSVPGLLTPGLFTLSSAGPVTQTGGGIQTFGLALAGPGTFTLNNAANTIQQLSTIGTGNVSFTNQGSFAVSSFGGRTYDSSTGQFVLLGGPTATFTGDLTATSLNGDIDVLSGITKTGGNASTLTLNAANSIQATGGSMTSASGPMNLVFNANAGSARQGTSIFIGGGGLATNGGNVSIGTQANTAVYIDNESISAGTGNVTITGLASTANVGSGSGLPSIVTNGVVDIQDTTIATTSGRVAINGSSPGTGVYFGHSSITSSSGSISVTGTDGGAGGFGVDVDASTIAASTGSVALTGISAGPVSPTLAVGGVRLHNDFGPMGTQSVVTAGGAGVTVFGSGTGAGADGVLVADGSIISATGPNGSVDVRGVATGTPAAGGASNTSFDYGVLIVNGVVQTTAPGTTVAISGSTNTSDAGLAFGAVPLPPNAGLVAGPVNIRAGSQGTIILRASNDGTASSLVGRSATVSSPGGTLVAAPASVASSGFSITSLDATPITLFGTGAGLSLDAQTAQTFSPALQTVVLGSNTQTGAITVNGQCAGTSGACVLTRPTVGTSLTLANGGAGSQGITLPFGLSLPGKTLTLLSAGAVTDPGGIQAANLLVSGPGSFTLNDPQNAVDTLSMANAGSVNFQNSHGFTIGPVVGQTFDSVGGRVVPIGGGNSTVRGDLFAQADTGGIALGVGASPTVPNGVRTDLSAGGSVDLVMENGVFTNAGSGTLTAGNSWRIWSQTWTGETRGNIQPNTAQPNFYGCTFGQGCSWGGVVPLTGNHYVYAERPTVTVTAGGATRFVGAANPQFTFTASGFINGDPAALNGDVTSPANQTSPAGTYPINPNFASGVGYLVVNVPGVLTVEPLPPQVVLDPVSQSGLQSFFTAQEQTFVYENNLQGTNICIGSNQPLFTTAAPGETQDLLAVEWKRVRSQPNLNSCMLLNSQHGCGDF